MMRYPTVATYRTRQGDLLTEALSPRELQVLRLVATGHSNAMIGDALCIDERTVRTHMSNIIAKLGARDRTHAVYIGYRVGLLPPPGTLEAHSAADCMRLAAHYAALAVQLMEATP